MIEEKTGKTPLDPLEFEPTQRMRFPNPAMKKKKKRHHLHPPKASLLSKGAVKNEINVTPLVDVVLVLLIIFMVVTPMLTRGVAIELPNTVHHDKRQDTGEQIVVSVAYDGRWLVESDAVTESSIGEAIQKALNEKKKNDGTAREVHVKADKRLTYGDVRKVLELVHNAGAPYVALGSEEIKSEGLAAKVAEGH